MRMQGMAGNCGDRDVRKQVRCRGGNGFVIKTYASAFRRGCERGFRGSLDARASGADCEFSARLRFPSPAAFAPIRAVKFAASLLALLAFSLTACNTLATRRDLYAPTKSSGPYTKWYREGGKWPRSDASATPAPQAPSVDAPVLH